MNIDTTFITRCINALARALDELRQEEGVNYELYRAAAIKEFEIVLEQSGKLLRKRLQPYFHAKKAVDVLNFKEVFRHAGYHGILTVAEVERWLIYRDNRNSTSHDYGANFAEQTLPLLPQFIADARALAAAIEKGNAAEGEG